ncbi:MAG: hypothetical protein DMF90_23815 [Acidobacteria bacterium]|nr:MAG: hypothetical protein DMF90_23815 [Acidobacteriota bacterium]
MSRRSAPFTGASNGSTGARTGRGARGRVLTRGTRFAGFRADFFFAIMTSSAIPRWPMLSRHSMSVDLASKPSPCTGMAGKIELVLIDS